METQAKKLSLKLILGCALTLTSSSPRVKKYELFILSSFGGGVNIFGLGVIRLFHSSKKRGRLVYLSCPTRYFEYDFLVCKS